MQKGYSKLLIHEVVINPLEPQEASSTSDITMMAMGAGIESMSSDLCFHLKNEFSQFRKRNCATVDLSA
jgi:hypothetical protein